VLFLRALTFLFSRLARLLSARNLARDRFGTMAAVLGVALGTATVDVVVILDVNTVTIEEDNWSTDPRVGGAPDTIDLVGIQRGGTRVAPQSAKEATHEDYEVMRSTIRMASLGAFLVGALIVFFTFGVVVDQRRREVALLRSLGALPRQLAGVLLREALMIGVAGGALGFVASIPMAWLGAAVGITTTGRSSIDPRHMHFPWAWMAAFAVVGAATAVLGVLRPAYSVLRLDVARALRPRFLEGDDGPALARRTRGFTLIALPFATLVYLLMRPFFRQALPSLTFFVIEAALVCAAFLATLLLVPELVQRLGTAVTRLVPSKPSAERLLTQRRVERMGYELAWSVSGVMLVFALLLSLHIATHALKNEVVAWADEAMKDELFLVAPPGTEGRADMATKLLPSDVVAVHMTSRTPWPNAVQAAPPAELAALAEHNGRPDAAALARRLGPGKILLSRMMARRFRVGEGDSMELSGRGGTRRLEIVAVTDALGFVPIRMPYRNAKTYATIDPADSDLIAPYASSLGATAVVADSQSPAVRGWLADARARGLVHVYAQRARWFRWGRIFETNKDFEIFDVMLLLTSALAAIGIANQLVLSVRARRRELALYRVLGMQSAQVRRMVMLEGTFIGFLGGVLAALLGVPLGYAAVGVLKAVSAFEVEFDLPPLYVLFTVVGSIVIATIAARHPAAEAARADAAESVHYE
jgi:putative ABC transport system permease protein